MEKFRLQECSLKNVSFWKLVISLEIYETETITSGLYYVEDLIFLENDIVWFLNSVEFYNILSYSRFFF